MEVTISIACFALGLATVLTFIGWNGRPDGLRGPRGRAKPGQAPEPRRPPSSDATVSR